MTIAAARSVARASLLSILLAGCSVGGSASEPGVSTPSAAVTPSSTAGASVEGSPPVSAPPPAIEGTWRTPLVTRADVTASLTSSGDAAWVSRFFDSVTWGDASLFTLRVRGGEWTQTWSSDGGPAVANDEGSYVLDGDRITITHDDGTDTLQWSVSDGKLTLTFVGSDIGSTDGIPERVFQIAFFATVSYQRISDQG
jgi:hypothetical protein